MASFSQAVEKTLRWEGGLTSDTGGKTKYGISQNAYPNLDIANLTIDAAKAIYKRDYWDKIGGDIIKSQKAAESLFDFAVNAGISRAVKEAQTVLSKLGTKLDIDGKPGLATYAAINRYGDLFGDKLTTARIDFYKGLSASNPAKYGVYLKGWLKRAQSFFSNGAGTVPRLPKPLLIVGVLVIGFWVSKFVKERG